MSAGQTYPMRGGLDEATPAIAIKPGAMIACLNMEAQPTGYQRTEGFERYDGRTRPSDEQIRRMSVILTVSLTAGQTINGKDSGATARVLLDTAAGSSELFLHNNAGGPFDDGEIIRVGLSNVGTCLDWVGTAHTPDSANALLALDAAAAYRRALIGNVPGANPIRGVLWFDGKLHAWRDSGGGTSCLAYYSSNTGWQQHDFGYILPFTSGGTVEITAGSTITGATSGATAVVRSVSLYPGGAWADGDAAGILVLDSVTGTFVAENLDKGASLNVATIAEAPEAMSFPPGGRYQFEVYNFRATSASIRAYGANGVGPGFEFDGVSVIPISTGMDVDTPFLVKAHKAHLFFAFEQGSLQHSGLGEPLSFSALIGAAELGVGSPITNLIPNTQSAFLITTEDSVFVLTGNDSSDWVMEGLSDEAGAKAWTAQRIGQVVYVDNRGVRNATATSSYGNFRLATYTSLLTKTLREKAAEGTIPVGSAVLKSKDQYLLFFDDDTGLSLFFGTKQPEAGLFTYPFTISCDPCVVEIDGKERIFVGAEDGYVYELNVGRSFDGEPIEAYAALPYGHQGNPRQVKRYQKLALELDCDYGTELGIVAQFDYAKGYQPNAEQLFHSVDPGGNPITAPDWPDFTFVAPEVGEVEAWLDGLGSNMGAIIVSRSKLVESYTLEAGTVIFSPRGFKR